MLASSPVRKLLIFAYMRGGSSLVGEAFSGDTDSWYWYEPLDGFYSHYLGLPPYTLPNHIVLEEGVTRRTLEAEEINGLTKFISNIFNCNFSGMPPESTGHLFMEAFRSTRMLVNCLKAKMFGTLGACKRFLPPACSVSKSARGGTAYQFIQNGCHKGIGALKGMTSGELNRLDKEHLELIMPEVTKRGRRKKHLSSFLTHEKCLRKKAEATSVCLRNGNVAEHCSATELRVAKILRLNVDVLYDVIAALPDIHILYYVRDPRAIAKSVTSLNMLATGFTSKNDTFREEITILCERMRYDISVLDTLNKAYPGTILLLKYEELVIDATTFGRKAFPFLGREFDESFSNMFISAASSKSEKTEGAFSTFRMDGRLAARRWRDKMAAEDWQLSSRVCGDVLKHFHYTK